MQCKNYVQQTQREETYQVTLDDLKLTPCYPAFLVTAKVPEVYMHQFWNTIQKICPRILNQDFIAPPSEEELVIFIQELGYSGKCISGKTIRLDRLRESRAQILWGMYNKKNVNYVALLWEDFMYQADNREISSARKYGALIPDDMINQDIKDSKAYKTYDFATRKVPLKKARKYKKVASPLRKLSLVLEEEYAEKPKKAKKPAKKSTTVPTTGVVNRDTSDVPVLKKKAPSKGDRGKGMELLFDAALLEAAQVKEAL
ncbi:hypothetical protein Tco_0222974 [Tanacetum coccineum]